jgi:hypothetical protein
VFVKTTAAPTAATASRRRHRHFDCFVDDYLIIVTDLGQFELMLTHVLCVLMIFD